MRCWSESTNTFTAPRYPKDIPKISTKLPGQQVSNAIVEGSLSSRSLRLQVGWISHWKLWIWINIYIYIFHLSILIYHSQIFYRLSQFESNLSISLIFCRWMAGRAAPCWRANLIEKEGLSPASQVRRMHLEDLNGWYLFGCFLT